MLSPSLVALFWEEVNAQLRQRWELKPDAALQAIADYKNLMLRHQMGEMVYHRDPDDVAATIAGGVKRGGFQSPSFQQESRSRSE